MEPCDICKMPYGHHSGLHREWWENKAKELERELKVLRSLVAYLLGENYEKVVARIDRLLSDAVPTE